MRISPLFSAAALLVAAAGCASQLARPGVDGSMTSVEEDLLVHLVTDAYPPADRVTCLAYERSDGNGWRAHDVSAEAIERLSAIAGSVVRGSECRLRNPVGGMMHVPSGRAAVAYHVRLLSLDGDRAELFGRWSARSLDAASCRYVAERRTDTWTFRRIGECVLS